MISSPVVPVQPGAQLLANVVFTYTTILAGI